MEPAFSVISPFLEFLRELEIGIRQIDLLDEFVIRTRAEMWKRFGLRKLHASRFKRTIRWEASGQIIFFEQHHAKAVLMCRVEAPGVVLAVVKERKQTALG